jgi:uncharacterized membrane protein YqgA involved in biofilm formation
MNPILKNVLAVIAGLIVGSIVNMSFIMIGPYIIPPPEGADVTSMEGLKASIHLFKPENYIFPFLAHAFGTLVGAFIAAKIAASHKEKMAWCVGCIFMIGGISNVLMLPAPLWFNILDLVGAYLPQAFLAGKLADKAIK